jgi:hypothetical protein
MHGLLPNRVEISLHRDFHSSSIPERAKLEAPERGISVSRALGKDPILE